MNKSIELITPILFLVFNRPDTTKEVFEVIRKVKPHKLYLASDGPRANNIIERSLVNEVREIISKIDWKCEVKTFFREKNVGCKFAVSEAINWFFSNEEYGIILEDDCLPDPSFFSFCQILLNKYRHNDNIMSICGSNINENLSTEYSCYFSKYPLMWGWATWSRAWEKYDVYMKEYPQFFKNNGLKKLNMGGIPFISSWKEIFDKTYLGEIDTWDYQWIFSCWNNNGITVAPKINLVKNIGFSENATHTKITDPIRSSLQIHKLDDNLNLPDFLSINYQADLYISKYWFHITWINLIKSKLLKIYIIKYLNTVKNRIFNKF
jgi:hypothetical protein